MRLTGHREGSKAMSSWGSAESISPEYDNNCVRYRNLSKLVVSTEVPFRVILHIWHPILSLSPFCSWCISFLPVEQLSLTAFPFLILPKLHPCLSIWLRVGRLEVRDEAPLVSYSSWCNREQPGSKLPSSGIIPAHAINEVIILDYKICIFKT